MKTIHILIGLVFVVILVSGCVEKTTSERDSQIPSSGIDGLQVPPIKVDLDLSEAPSLNETAELTVSLTPFTNISDVSAKIVLPEGLAFMSGDLSWSGDVERDKTVQFRAMIKAMSTGNWTIDAQVTGGRGFLFLSISEDSAYISKRPLVNSNRSKPRMLVEVNESEIPPRSPSIFSDIPQEVNEKLAEPSELNLRPMLS